MTSKGKGASQLQVHANAVCVEGKERTNHVEPSMRGREARKCAYEKNAERNEGGAGGDACRRTGGRKEKSKRKENMVCAKASRG